MSFFEKLPSEVSVYEVSPRDGLQNEASIVPTHGKARLIRALIEAGVKRIEVTSFVSPKWIPQMADAKELLSLLEKPEDVTFSALCPNERGLERAISAGVNEIAVFVSASETHNQKNVNKSITQTLKAFENVIEPAIREGMKVRGYISTLWGCPYEGFIDTQKGIDIATELFNQGCYQISLGDTIGVGTPVQTKHIVERFTSLFDKEKIALHLHDTRGTAIANAIVGLEMGMTTFDASIAGLGGCPYAPGAAGNLASEDLVYTLNGMGIKTGVDLEKLWNAGQVAEALVGRKLPGKVHKAGVQSLHQ